MDIKLINCMIDYYAGDAKRIQHFLKVYEFARLIGLMEGLDEHTQNILESAAVVHDIGIKISEQKYGSSAGNYQEMEGPEEARKMLESLDYPKQDIERICYLVGHHHTYNNIDGTDYQILVEADFLVNLYEDSSSLKTIETVYHKIFKTEYGKRLCRKIYLDVV